MYYKVVDNSKRSIVSHNYCVQYKLNEWAYPHKDLKDSKLFVFDSYENALNFRNDMGYGEIYECEVKNPKKVKFVAGLSSLYSFWEAKRKKKKYIGFKQSYKGTVGCDAVKLIENID